MKTETKETPMFECAMLQTQTFVIDGWENGTIGMFQLYMTEMPSFTDVCLQAGYGLAVAYVTVKSDEREPNQLRTYLLSGVPLSLEDDWKTLHGTVEATGNITKFPGSKTILYVYEV